MITAVADTNIYISALLFGGTCEAILGLARAGRLTCTIRQPFNGSCVGFCVRSFAGLTDKFARPCWNSA